MMRRIHTILLIFVAVTLTACGGGGGGDDIAGNGGGNGGAGNGGDISNLTLGLSTVASGLEGPIHLTAPAGDARLFVVERPGRIRIVRNGTLLSTPFINLSGRNMTTGEGGLLSMAFHPQYATNGFFYVVYTNTDGDIAIERFTVSSTDPDLADPASGDTILIIPHPASSIHNGGMLQFGPDGMLYISTGDGGVLGDPSGNAQNLNSLLGKLLRIDVTNTGAETYAIPSDNPFAGQAGARPEIWAYGLRNPWRYSFDFATSLLYLTDVGEGSREEVNVVGLSEPGLNFGWNVLEGSLCFSLDMTVTECAREGKRMPTLEYAHENGACSIIGGYVYRGSSIPELQGRYFYSDFCSGWLRSFSYSGGTATEQKQWDVGNLARIYSFGQDANGELYALTGAGGVLRLVRQP